MSTSSEKAQNSISATITGVLVDCNDLNAASRNVMKKAGDRASPSFTPKDVTVRRNRYIMMRNLECWFVTTSWSKLGLIYAVKGFGRICVRWPDTSDSFR